MEYKIAEAETHLSIMVTCPYCGSYKDIIDNDHVKESIGFDLRAENADLEIKCDRCNKIFIVNDILY